MIQAVVADELPIDSHVERSEIEDGILIRTGKTNRSTVYPAASNGESAIGCLLSLVIDADEDQAVRRNGLASAAAVAGGENLGRPIDVASAPPHFDKRADNDPYHVV